MLPLETFHLTKITEIFTTSAQFKSINEVLKFSISTLIKQTARLNADLENVRAKTVVLVISYFLKLTSQITHHKVRDVGNCMNVKIQTYWDESDKWEIIQLFIDKNTGYLRYFLRALFRSNNTSHRLHFIFTIVLPQKRLQNLRYIVNASFLWNS